MMAASSMERKKKSKKQEKVKCLSLKSCFGFSGSSQQDDLVDSTNCNKSFKNGSKRSSARAKTVPVNDLTLTVKGCVVPSKEIHVAEAEEKRSDNHRQVKDHKALIKKLEKPKTSFELGSTKSTILPLETHSKRRRLSHSFSLPLPRLKRAKTTSPVKGKNGNEIILEGEIEPLVGALILVVVLIVMLIWGKLCAILCAAMWFYFIPCFNSISSSTVMKLEKSSSQVDFDSKEYKKRVVLAGLLERNQQARK